MMESFRPRVCLRCLRTRRSVRAVDARCLNTTAASPPPSHSAAPPPPPPRQPQSRPPTASPALFTLQPQTLHSYKDARPPTDAQLAYATHFFASSAPQHLWTAAQFRTFPSSTHPEVAFLGRSNVGKSSLLNALFNRTRVKTAHVSSKPGRTRTMNAFGVGGTREDIAAETERWKGMGRGGVVVVDMPGYGKGSREEWGAEIMKYVLGRKQLRRTFLLVDAEHGLKSTDLALLQALAEHGIAHQIILSKVDKLLHPRSRPPSPQSLSDRLLRLRALCDDIRDKAQPDTRGGRVLGDILCVSAEKELVGVGSARGKLGVDALRWAVLSAAGLDCDELGRKRAYEAHVSGSADL